MHAHGDTYNGQWDADTMHGKGIMYYKDGSVYDGDWEHGKVRHLFAYRSKKLKQVTYLSTRTPAGSKSSRYRWRMMASAVLV